MPDTITNWKFQGDSYVLPTAFGAAGSVLSDAAGDGILSWAPAGGGGASYDVYTALLNQSGENAPVATVLENTLGGDIIWTRDNAGQYTGTLANAFTADKTFLLFSFPNNSDNLPVSIIQRVDADSINVIVSGDNRLTNDRAFVEIRVYP